MPLWEVGFLAGFVVVLVVALLLALILVEAMRIRNLARAAAGLVDEIDRNTRGIWALTQTNAVAGALLQGARAIDDNAAAIVMAMSEPRGAKSAA